MGRDRRFGLVGAFTLGIFGCAVAPPPPPAAKLAESTSHCPSGFEEGPAGTCFLLPTQPSATSASVLYVHSAASPAALHEEWAVVQALFGASSAILLARGTEADCGLTGEVKRTLCWPASETESAAVWERWDKVQWQAEALLPEGEHPRLVIGFKEGAVFAARAFKHGAVRARALAVIAPEEPLEAAPYPGWLLGFGAPAASDAAFARGGSPFFRCPRQPEGPLNRQDLEEVDAAFERVRAHAGAALAGSACTVSAAPSKRPRK